VRLPEGVAFRGGHPIDDRARDDYFDALYHAAAIVGLNTSALIEGAIVDRPVLTILLPEFQASQGGTLHFGYLLAGPDALLHAASDLSGHLAQLEAAISGSLPDRNAAFVRRFVRPHGVHSAATPAFVQALESLAAEPVSAECGAPAGRWAWRQVVANWYRAAAWPRVQSWMLEASHGVEERDRAERIEDKQTRRRLRDAERRSRALARELRYRAKRRRQRVAQLRTVVRRVLPTGSGGGGMQP